MPIHLDITPEFMLACGGVKLACLSADVVVAPSPPALLELLDALTTELSSWDLNRISSSPPIAATREAYRRLGKDPSRYRGSSEALLRRVVSGKGLYRINNVVDINNLVSLRNRLPIGCHDVEKLSGAITLRAGRAGEPYKGIGKDVINIEDLPVLADQEGPFGSPSSDSQRAMIRPETRTILMVFYAFGNQPDPAPWAAMAAGLLTEHASGKNIVQWSVS